MPARRWDRHTDRDRNTGATPTARMLRALEAAYDHFNQRLFAGELPPALLNLSRLKGRPAAGFFKAEAWAGAGGRQRICELSITPLGTTRPSAFVYATLVHEMAHYLEHVRGEKPKSPGYHGKAWWATMQGIGLPPKPFGNSRIRVSHAIDPKGAFAKAFAELPAELRLPFVSVEREASDDKSKHPTKQGRRARYECPECETTMRGPSGRILICGDCEQHYVETGF